MSSKSKTTVTKNVARSGCIVDVALEAPTIIKNHLESPRKRGSLGDARSSSLASESPPTCLAAPHNDRNSNTWRRQGERVCHSAPTLVELGRVWRLGMGRQSRRRRSAQVMSSVVGYRLRVQGCFLTPLLYALAEQTLEKTLPPLERSLC